MNLFRKYGALLVTLLGFAILCIFAADGKFNGGDLLGWILLFLGVFRILHPVPQRRRK